MKVRPAGKMPDKPMSVAVLKAVLREKITGSPDESIRQFFREKLAQVSTPSGRKNRKKDPDPFLTC